MDHVCIHLKAAAEVVPFTHRMRLDTAAHLLDNDYIQVGEAGICTASTLADQSRVATFRPAERFCTCGDCQLHGTCCHLLAASKLLAFKDQELPTGLQEEGTEDEVRKEWGPPAACRCLWLGNES